MIEDDKESDHPFLFTAIKVIYNFGIWMKVADEALDSAICARHALTTLMSQLQKNGTRKSFSAQDQGQKMHLFSISFELIQIMKLCSHVFKCWQSFNFSACLFEVTNTQLVILRSALKGCFTLSHRFTVCKNYTMFWALINTPLNTHSPSLKSHSWF